MTVQFARKFTLAVAVVAFVGAASLTGVAQAKIDITGKWVFDVVIEGGGGQPTFTLKQEGEKITGHMSSMTFGEVDVTGTLKGQDLTIAFKSDALGADAEVTYKGKVESNDLIKGTFDIGGLGSGTFTGTRAKS
jgi:hypothetical protein